MAQVEKTPRVYGDDMVRYHEAMMVYYEAMVAREGALHRAQLMKLCGQKTVLPVPAIPKEPERPSMYHEMPGSSALWQVQTTPY